MINGAKESDTAMGRLQSTEEAKGDDDGGRGREAGSVVDVEAMGEGGGEAMATEALWVQLRFGASQQKTEHDG